MTRILLADDDSDLRFITEMALSDAGYEVVTAENGQEAASLAGKDPFDVILLDAMMPVMDGYTAYKELRAKPATASIPVIFLTAQAPDSNVLKQLGVPRLDYILKPCDPDSLAQKIEHILSKRKTQN